MRMLLAIDGSIPVSQTVQPLTHLGPLDEVSIVHVLHLPNLEYPLIPPELREEASKAIEGTLRADGERLLDQAVAALPQGVGQVHRIHEIGEPSRVILESAQSTQADLIVIGARGLGPIKEMLLGSVSHRVLLHAPCSTLVVRNPMPALNHILIPVEGQEDAENILRFLYRLSFNQSVQITVMTVWPQPQLPFPATLGQSKQLEERALEHAGEITERIVQELAQHNVTARAVVGMGEPAFAILEQAKALQPDLLIAGSHGRSGVSRFLMGSVSHTLVHRAPCPVLIVR
ncbi:MAG: universal stress protein [Nitrospira sp.]|nr:universal stress protein [Nitrospira sp.]